MKTEKDRKKERKKERNKEASIDKANQHMMNRERKK